MALFSGTQATEAKVDSDEEHETRITLLLSVKRVLSLGELAVDPEITKDELEV